ncbi:MAG: hypothetical protein G8345_11340 [Magnetococcales bacterium]|nr:hypothetical protein [Magnetococcales bacterium]
MFTSRFAKLDDVLTTLGKYKLREGEVKIIPDPSTKSLYLQGSRAQVTGLIRILEKIDEAYKKQQEDALYQKRRTLEQENLNNALNNAMMEVRVIHLRFASVAQSRTVFQGETITIPGIIESLNAFLGGSLDIREAGKPVTTHTPQENSNGNVFSGSPRPTVSIDQRTNSVIVQGTPTQVETIDRVINQLDKPVPLVEIEVMIVDGMTDIIRELGIGWGVAGYAGKNAAGQNFNQLSTDGTAPTTLPNANSGFYDLASRPTLTSSGARASFIFRGAREVLNARLDMMAQDNKLQTIASPRVITLNNQPAKITNSKNVSFITTTGDGTRSDVKTVNSGITLDITPSVIETTPDDKNQSMVRLKITAKNSSITNQTAQSVNTDEQEVQTNVILHEGATFVMGGLFNTRREEVETGVPGLKDIPIVGSLFKLRKSEDRKSETVFLITPRVYALNQNNLPKDQMTASYMRQQKQDFNINQYGLRTSSPLLNIDGEAEEDE